MIVVEAINKEAIGCERKPSCLLFLFLSCFENDNGGKYSHRGGFCLDNQAVHTRSPLYSNKTTWRASIVWFQFWIQLVLSSWDLRYVMAIAMENEGVGIKHFSFLVEGCCELQRIQWKRRGWWISWMWVRISLSSFSKNSDALFRKKEKKLPLFYPLENNVWAL